MIKVKWLKAHHKFAYSKGDTGYVTPDWAEKLLEGGYIILVPEAEGTVPAPAAAPPAAPAENPLPEDLPGREKLFVAGFKTLDELRSAGDSLLDAGISVTMLKKITKYLKG